MSAITLRYAQAFSSVVTSQKIDTNAAQQQLKDFADTFQSSRELRDMLMNPAIPGEQKLRVLDGIAGKLGMFPQVRNFIAVIMDRQRLGELEHIVTQYHAVVSEKSGMAEAEITSAHALNDADRSALEANVAKIAGGQIRATYREDPALLGGVVVRIGSTVYDGSIRSQLQQLRQKLVSA